ncbi:hypothetical protein [Acinetobacter indicus]|uniref:hypothetical protein n=1 Tax=Acinetobacter indicus TaxID=756892 RepID=UPI002E32F381|nr:hypothetical protein [Acinetobacter indicus]
MKNKIVKIAALSLSAITLSGCSGLKAESKEFKESVESSGRLIASSFLEDKVEILDNGKVNTEHKPYMSDIELQANHDSNSVRFSAYHYPDLYTQQCISLLKVRPNDFKSNGGRLSGGHFYSLKDENDPKLNDFKKCIEIKYESSPIFEDDLRLFLSEPVLIAYRENQRVRERLDEIKKDGVLTLSEVIGTYKLLDQVYDQDFISENKSLLSEL